MSGKKAQRTKGNTQPSSSSRSAKFLQHEGQTGLISFSGLAGNASGIASQDIGDVNVLDAELRLLLRKMAKKDTITRLKAVQEFILLCKEKDGDMIKNMLNFWPRMYNKLSHDFDHRVRESTQQAHYQLTTKAGRNLAPHLKQIIVNWLMSQFDNHVPAATNAKMSFDEVFQEKKRREVLLFCKTEILQACEKNILRETADTLSDPKFVSLEERESKYNRFISSTFLLLKYLLENLETNDDDVIKDNLKILFAEKKFWKFSKHHSPMIRSSFFTLLLSFCEQLTSLMEESLQLISPIVLSNIDEQDPVVTKALWDVILYCLSTFKNLWQFVNVRKAVWPKLWKLLKAGCYGNIKVVYPNLLPFLSNIPPEVVGEGTVFYAEFFSHVSDILLLKQKVLSECETKLVISTYVECMRRLLVKNLNNKELSDFIVWNLIADSLHTIFHSAEEYRAWYGVFIKELHLLLSYLCKEVIKNDENSEYYKTLYTDLWKVISVVIFIESDGKIKFKFIESESDIKFIASQSNFYKSLMAFLSYCCENLSAKNTSDTEIYNNIETENDDLFLVFIHNIIRCYIIEIFSQKQFAVGDQLIKLVSLSCNIDLIRFVCVEKLHWENKGEVFDESSNVNVCNTFVNSIVLPLLGADAKYQKEIVEVTIGLVTVLHGADKQDYLISIFERELFSGYVLLALFVEVFRYSKEENVVEWLKSSFVEKEIMKLCTFEKDDDHADRVNLKWQILRMYIHIVEDNPDKLSLYHNKLLVLIKHCIESGDQSSDTIDDAVLATFTSLCTSSFEISKTFQETLFVIFHHNVSQAETESSVDTMNKGFVMLMHQQQDIVHFKEMVDKLIGFAKDCCINQVNCSKLCTAMCSLVQLAQNHSNEISYGKVMLEEIFRGDQESVNNQDEGNSTMFKFYSEFLKVLSAADSSILQTCYEKKLNDIILKCISVGEKKKDDVTKDIKECIKSCEFIHFSLVDDAIHRCLRDSAETDVAKTLLQTLLDNDQLSESILDHILMLSVPSKHNYMNFACDTYCMVVSMVNDISCIRALVEMYVDELKNNEDVRNSNTVFGQFIKVLCGVISKWYKILNSLESDLEDYYDIVYIVMRNILTWKDDHSEMVLFSCSLAETDPSIISLNIHLIQLLCYCAETALEVFKAEHWDFLLCSMVSWLQSCEESLDCFKVQSLYPQFMHTSFQLFNMIACVFDSCAVTTEASTCNISPCIYLKDAIPMSLPALNDDTVTEWKELFLPTASASLLHIYMTMMKKGQLNVGFTELEQTLCSCIRFVPPFTINEFVCSGCDDDSERQKALEEFCNVCCQIVASGSWWNKIGSYQLLTGLGESIEGKLCYISQKEDEEHEGMRSFPSSLIQAMENSRDETLKVLSAEGVSIKDPLKSFEHMKGKLELLTYLLSWQLILQLFKMADPSNRAMFANYFHNNSDVHDLITCLFCLMPQSINLENKKKITLINFTFTEIRQVAFHLLTTAMECIPALIRNWFNNHVNRVDTGTVNRFVSNFISPLLLKNEFQNLNESSKEFNNMIVKTRAVAREIAAVYTVDEVSMELVVQLGQNHPLSPVSVTCGKRIGVSNSLWRQWMLQLNTFLSFQNGSILDGLALWKRNVDKRFEGVEECMVCFSVLHGSNYSLPSIGCKTCKKKFHPACLYKWFNTSGKCTCPLCRNIF